MNDCLKPYSEGSCFSYLINELTVTPDCWLRLPNRCFLSRLLLAPEASVGELLFSALRLFSLIEDNCLNIWIGMLGGWLFFLANLEIRATLCCWVGSLAFE